MQDRPNAALEGFDDSGRTRSDVPAGAEKLCLPPNPRGNPENISMAATASIEFGYSRADAGRILGCLIAIELLLVFAYGLVHIVLPQLGWGPLRELFDLNRESAIPTWFSTIQLFTISALLVFVARLPTPLRRYLVLLGMGFLFLSMDEAAEIHEKIIGSVRALEWRWLLWLTFDGSHKAWMIPYLILALGTAAACYRFFIIVWRSHRSEALIVAAGLALFGVGGIGFELLTFLLYFHPSKTLYLLAIAGEEFFEMAGMSVVLYGVLLLHLKFAALHVSGSKHLS